MASLLDTIRGNLAANQAQPVAAPDKGEQVRKLLAAKSGKAVPASSPDLAQSNLAEASAIDQTRMGQQQLGQQSAIAGQQIAQEQQKLSEQERLGRQQLNLQQKANTLQNRVQTEQLLRDLDRDKESLNLDKDRVKLEQLSHNLALQDKKYVDNLQRVGQMQRLQNDLGFREALAKAAYQDDLDLLSEDIVSKSNTAQSMRDLDKSLASRRLIDWINNDYAESKAAEKRGRWEAVGKLTSAGSQASTVDWKKPSSAGSSSGNSGGSSTTNSTSTRPSQTTQVYGN